jgi:hypothetical protein
MPMIDVYATAGTFEGKHRLVQELAAAVMRWERLQLAGDPAISRQHSTTSLRRRGQPWPGSDALDGRATGRASGLLTIRLGSH